MRELFRKILVIFFIFALVLPPAYAKKNSKQLGNISHEFYAKEVPEQLVIISGKEIPLYDGTIIPEHAILTFDSLHVQKEKRWHKSAYVLCRLNNYFVEDLNQKVDFSDKDMYFAIRKYQAINKKDASILGTEIVLTQAASIVGSCFIYFAPVDIVYFFAKGAILREKHPNWFKAGVFNAYDNSICWFWLKGRTIDMEQGAYVKINTVKEKKALKLMPKIDKRNEKLAVKDEKRQAKLQKKEEKELAKRIENGDIDFSQYREPELDITGYILAPDI